MLYSTYQTQDHSQLKPQDDLSAQCDNSSITRVSTSSYENVQESEPKETKDIADVEVTMVHNQKCQLEASDIPMVFKKASRKSRPYRAISKEDTTSGYVMTIGFGETPVIIRNVNCLDKNYLFPELPRESLQFSSVTRDVNTNCAFMNSGVCELGCVEVCESESEQDDECEELDDDVMIGIDGEEEGIEEVEEGYDDELSDGESNEEEDAENSDDSLSMTSEDSLDYMDSMNLYNL
jgi:hypothetical protein